MSGKATAIYMRTSTDDQVFRSQEPELEAWVKAYAGSAPIERYEDQASGATMERPGWQRLLERVRSGKVGRIVVWRLDRLGRTTAGLASLLEELRARKVDLVSVREGIDPSTSTGKMVASILSSVAEFELEVRRERQSAGIAAAKAEGKTWGGREKGDRYKVTPEVERQIRKLLAANEPKAAIARALGISRSTVYAVLAE